MFITLSKISRPKQRERDTFDRYFKEAARAVEMMDEEVKDLQSHGYHIVEDVSCYRRDKGFYECYKTLKSKDGGKVTYSIINSYFQDESESIQ